MQTGDKTVVYKAFLRKVLKSYEIMTRRTEKSSATV